MKHNLLSRGYFYKDFITFSDKNSQVSEHTKLTATSECNTLVNHKRKNLLYGHIPSSTREPHKATVLNLENNALCTEFDNDS